MQFDHLDRKTKTDNIADMVRRGVSFAVLKAEIRKCELRCANCHAEIEHKRRN